MDSNKDVKFREHLANERTFLAWIRTGIALMGFGFVIVKFALFLKQLSLMFNLPEMAQNTISGITGVSMVAFGVILAGLSLWQYLKMEKQISREEYRSTAVLPILVSFILLIGGIFLIIYLLPTIT
jgi:putative membrane protein